MLAFVLFFSDCDLVGVELGFMWEGTKGTTTIGSEGACAVRFLNAVLILMYLWLLLDLDSGFALLIGHVARISLDLCVFLFALCLLYSKCCW